MKKAFTAIISIVLCVSTLASCANSTVKKQDDATNIITDTELVLTIQATDGGYLEKSVDESGALYVAPRAMDGYAFDGYYVNGVKISDSTYSVAEGVTVTANFIRV